MKPELLTFKMLLLSYSFCQMDHFSFFKKIANYLVTGYRYIVDPSPPKQKCFGFFLFIENIADKSPVFGEMLLFT